MAQQDENLVPVAIGVIAIFFAGVAWKISTALGADWAVTLNALVWSVVYTAGVSGVWWWISGQQLGYL